MSDNIDKIAERGRAKPYDLSQNSERTRLLMEVRGYLHTCRREHHGTDWSGRQFAIDALDLWLIEQAMTVSP